MADFCTGVQLLDLKWNADLKSAASPDAESSAIFPVGALEADFKSAFHRDAKRLWAFDPCKNPPWQVRLMFQDEARFGRMVKIRRCWSPTPVRPMGNNGYEREFTYVYGAVSPLEGDSTGHHHRAFPARVASFPDGFCFG
jgi:hypothetical protein